MNGRSSKAEGVTKSRLKRVESDTNGRMQNARYGVDGLRTKKQEAVGNSSREYGAGISTSASTPLTPNSTAPSISYISGHMILGAEINGEFVYHLGDALSTVRDVVDDEGDVIRSFEFDEYGNLLNSSGSGATSPKTWIGGLSVNDDRADSGLWNMGHRNYASGVLGRFISRDPIGFTGGLNLYSYPTNPVNAVDPSGLKFSEWARGWQRAAQHFIGFLTGVPQVNSVTSPSQEVDDLRHSEGVELARRYYVDKNCRKENDEALTDYRVDFPYPSGVLETNGTLHSLGSFIVDIHPQKNGDFVQVTVRNEMSRGSFFRLITRPLEMATRQPKDTFLFSNKSCGVMGTKSFEFTWMEFRPTLGGHDLMKYGPPPNPVPEPFAGSATAYFLRGNW